MRRERNLVLFIDNHEPQDLIDHIKLLLKSSNSQVIVQHIETGDIVFGEVGIERKQVNDFIHSLRPNAPGSHHTIWNQLDTLRRTYTQPILLVEGQRLWTDPWFSGGLTTIILFLKYQTIFTDNKIETAQAIARLYEKYGKGKSGRPPPCAVKKRRTVGDIMYEILQVCEGVGPVTAKRILEAISHHDFVFMNNVEFAKALEKVKSLKKESRELLVKVFKEA